MNNRILVMETGNPMPTIVVEGRKLEPKKDCCGYCDEPFKPGERQIDMLPIDSPRVHYECLMRMVIGSVAHQQKRCPCYGQPDEPITKSLREDALEAYAYHQRHSPPPHPVGEPF